MGRPYPTDDIPDLSGQGIERYPGAIRYTIGQKKGLGLALNKPVYACGRDMEENYHNAWPGQSLYSWE